MLMFKMATRNIRRQRRRTVLTVLTMLGGFALASISIAWSDGTYNGVIDMFTRNHMGHIQVHKQGYLDRPSLYKTVENYEAVGNKLAGTPGVVSWAPRIMSGGLVSVGDKSSGARIVGIDPEREDETTRFSRKIVTGSGLSTEAAHEAVLGQVLAKSLRASVGDELVIVSQGADGSIANDLYLITGLAATGNQTMDASTLFLHLEDAQELLVLEGRVHEIVVLVDELDDVEEISAAISSNIDNPELSVEPWQVFARSFYRAMKADQQGTWISLAIIILIVAVGVLNTVLMMVLERTREYGLLRAIGTSPGQVFRLVVLEVLVMAVISTILGAVVAYGANYTLSVYGMTMTHPFTYGGIEFSEMYAEINARSFYIPALCILISATIVSLFPAGKASHVAPAKAMRTH